MVVGKSIVNSHIFEEALDVLVKEALHFAVVEVRVDENRANVGFENIRQALNHGQYPHIKVNHASYLRRLFHTGPIINTSF